VLSAEHAAWLRRTLFHGLVLAGLIVGAYIAIRFPASVFGSVVYGFQRFYLNNIISIISAVVVALVNARGIAESVRLNAALTFIEVGGLILIIVIGFAALGDLSGDLFGGLDGGRERMDVILGQLTGLDLQTADTLAHGLRFRHRKIVVGYDG